MTKEIDIDDWEETMQSISERRSQTLRIPRSASFSRAQVVNAFTSAFELIGGIPRLALWADKNPTEFYKLYAKLMPSTSATNASLTDMGDNNTLIIEHTLPRTELDKPNE